jgi:biopolymer transport protein ExbD
MKFITEHRTINTFHFSAALNVVMILLIFVIVFFVHYSKSGIRIVINNTAAGQIENTKDVVSINENDKVLIDKEELSQDKLMEKLSIIGMNQSSILIVRPSKFAKYNTIISVISSAKRVGVKNITVLTDMASF